MQIKIDFTKSAQENADDYYKKSKKLLQKKIGAEKSIKDLEKKLLGIKSSAVAERKTIIIKKPGEWYQKFHWMHTPSGFLAIGGRDAKQNETLNSKYFDDNDLFFHADIFGASVFILKNGAEAKANDRECTAQFAACYSSAWKKMLPVVDVYSMRREQVSKSTEKGTISSGSFLLKGEREWYRNMQLELIFFVVDGELRVIPGNALSGLSGLNVQKYVIVHEGKSEKADAAKEICKMLGYGDIDMVMRQLPAGTFWLAHQNPGNK